MIVLYNLGQIDFIRWSFFQVREKDLKNQNILTLQNHWLKSKLMMMTKPPSVKTELHSEEK